MTTATELREQATECERRAEESWERSDTDGFLSQWASQITAQKYRVEATIQENGGVASFSGLYEGSRRVAAKLIEGQYGTVWILRDDEAAKFGRFVPYGQNSRKQRTLGLRESAEWAPAKAVLAGKVNVYAAARRTGDEWGQDAVEEVS